MRYVRLGNGELEVSRIALGSWLTIGHRVDDAGTRRLLARARDLGVNLIDTADSYNGGETERVLARAMREHPRETFRVATKVFWPVAGELEDRGLSPDRIRRALDGSLRRLGVDAIDLYQAHRFDPETPTAEVVGVMGELIQAGKIRAWGVSGWFSGQVEEAVKLAHAADTPPPISNQSQYSLLCRWLDPHLPAYARVGVAQLAYGVLGQGVLTGKYGGGQRPADARAADPASLAFMRELLSEGTLARVELLRPVAREVGVSLAQLATAWCLRRDEVGVVIAGARAPRQLEVFVSAVDVRIPPDVLRRIDSILPPPAKWKAPVSRVLRWLRRAPR